MPTRNPGESFYHWWCRVIDAAEEDAKIWIKRWS